MTEIKASSKPTSFIIGLFLVISYYGVFGPLFLVGYYNADQLFWTLNPYLFFIAGLACGHCMSMCPLGVISVYRQDSFLDKSKTDWYWEKVPYGKTLMTIFSCFGHGTMGLVAGLSVHQPIEGWLMFFGILGLSLIHISEPTRPY